MWNPAFSSYTWERFKTDQEDMCEEYVSHDLYLTQEDKSLPLTDADFLNRVRCVCPSCQNAGKKVFYKKLY